MTLTVRRMLTSSARLLRLLSHLQVPGVHTGSALAARLGVSARTVRNDIASLRELGYPVHAAPGAAGGYRLGSGTSVPPLLLDDQEAVAIALGLTMAAGAGVSDVEQDAVRALGKLVAMLPARLRGHLEALTRFTSALPAVAVPVESGVLQDLAGAIQARVRVRFAYRDAREVETHREAEPYRLVLRSGRWYLLGWDPDRDDWRSFRIDRMRMKIPHGRRYTPRAAPAGGFAEFLARSLDRAAWTSSYRVRLHAPAEAIRRLAPPAVEVTPEGEGTCVVTVGSSDAMMLARYLSWWDTDFEILDSPELLETVRVLARRYTAAGRTLA